MIALTQMPLVIFTPRPTVIGQTNVQSPKVRNTMSAIVTTTSQTVETRIVSNGNEVSTSYFDSLVEAMNHLDTFLLDSIEIENMDI